MDQAGGAEVTQFERPYTLTVTGTIDDRAIGGMTLYVAPESAFGRHVKPALKPHHTHDLFGLNIPWQQCEVDGEIEIKLRFRKH